MPLKVRRFPQLAEAFACIPFWYKPGEIEYESQSLHPFPASGPLLDHLIVQTPVINARPDPH